MFYPALRQLVERKMVVVIWSNSQLVATIISRSVRWSHRITEQEGDREKINSVVLIGLREQCETWSESRFVVEESLIQDWIF